MKQACVEGSRRRPTHSEMLGLQRADVMGGIRWGCSQSLANPRDMATAIVSWRGMQAPESMCSRSPWRATQPGIRQLLDSPDHFDNKASVLYLPLIILAWTQAARIADPDPLQLSQSWWGPLSRERNGHLWYLKEGFEAASSLSFFCQNSVIFSFISFLKGILAGGFWRRKSGSGREYWQVKLRTE